MTGKEADHTVEGIRLLPHQAALVEQVAGRMEPKVIVLEGEAGLGKSVALAVACARLISTEPSGRALLLVPGRALGEQFVSLLHSLNVRADMVNRYRFREMLDAAAGEVTWSNGQVWVLGWELAGQPDVAASLESTRWTVVVADEAHRAAEQPRNFLRSISRVADRVVVATATVPGHDFASILGQPVDHVRWRREEVLAKSGLNLSLSLAPTLDTIAYSPSEAELGLDMLVDAVVNAADPMRLAGRMENLKRSRRSGPAALENALRGFLQRDAAADLLANLEEPVEDNNEVNRATPLDRPDSQPDLAPLVVSALTALDGLEVDSKLAAFTAFLERLDIAGDSESRRVCIVTEYVATLFYLAADLEARGRDAFLVHGSMSAEEREKAFEEFHAGRGLLLATHATLKGIELLTVTDVVFYDVPRTFGAFQAILGRFDRIGRKGELRIHLLASNTEPHPLDESTRRALPELIE